ncbi:hypothetical protein FRC14_006326 [Serendipita sp. 396]|nr:hypothetical protein FRC14_006326 [Serendipita sp. 396]KAG8778486.1 hypothetical protein FRC15_010773 [Serendipita sp. 397]KAG8796331.1 hypothetical protein FRC16_009737 [Serendipita sp. 398]KAG8828467.1 hypothetical protein FRC19_003806 [Serendipita sp. 401]KAG8864435.1 hypothetical protein FRC20_010195 [Serendipita sp. 405]KAG9058111.1 hypothetical protein FS842_001295 [Serendipita sp. 407]
MSGSLLVTLIAVVSVLAAPVTELNRCANSVTPSELIALESQFAIDYQLAIANATARVTGPIGLQRWTVHVAWHVIQESTTLTGGSISNDDISSSISALNQHYANTGFYFVLDGISTTTNSDWFRSVDAGNSQQTAMKKALHVGDARKLNVYSVGFKNIGLLGYSTFPWDYKGNPTDDGVVILYSSIPGGSTANYNQGKTLTHEVGHWLGLYHVFSDVGSCTDNDAVADTPIQSAKTRGCPSSQDSCPKSPGLDSIHNFMDYSDDRCMTEFTSGQAERMKAQVLTYRGIEGLPYIPTLTLPPGVTIPFPTLITKSVSTTSRWLIVPTFPITFHGL